MEQLVAQALSNYEPQTAAASAAVKRLVEVLRQGQQDDSNEDRAAAQEVTERQKADDNGDDGCTDGPDETVDAENHADAGAAAAGDAPASISEEEPPPLRKSASDEDTDDKTPPPVRTRKWQSSPAEDAFWCLFGRMCGAQGEMTILHTVARQLLDRHSHQERHQDPRSWRTSSVLSHTTIEEEVEGDPREENAYSKQGGSATALTSGAEWRAPSSSVLEAKIVDPQATCLAMELLPTIRYLLVTVKGSEGVEDLEEVPAAWLAAYYLHTALCYDERQKGAVYAAGGLYALLRTLHRFTIVDDFGSQIRDVHLTPPEMPLHCELVAELHVLTLKCLEELACFSCGVVELSLWLQLVRATLPSKGDGASHATSLLLGALDRALVRSVEGPRCSVSLDGFGSGMLGPSMKSWPFRTGLGCAAWLCIENFHEPIHAREMASYLAEAVVQGRPLNMASGHSPSVARANAATAAGGSTSYSPRIFSLLTIDGHGLEAYFNSGFLVVEMHSEAGFFEDTIGSNDTSSGPRAVAHFNFTFRPKEWYFICLEFVPRRRHASDASRDEAILYVNGEAKEIVKLAFPRVSKPLAFCCLGQNPPPTMSGLQRRRKQCCVHATLGPAYIFSKPVGQKFVEALAKLGPDYVPALAKDDSPLGGRSPYVHLPSSVLSAAEASKGLSNPDYEAFVDRVATGHVFPWDRVLFAIHPELTQRNGEIPNLIHHGANAAAGCYIKCVGGSTLNERVRLSDSMHSLGVGAGLAVLPLLCPGISTTWQALSWKVPSTTNHTAVKNVSIVFRILAHTLKFNRGARETFRDVDGSCLVSHVVHQCILQSVVGAGHKVEMEFIEGFVYLASQTSTDLELFSKMLTTILDLRLWRLDADSPATSDQQTSLRRCAYFRFYQKLLECAKDLILRGHRQACFPFNPVSHLLDTAHELYQTMTTVSRRDPSFALGDDIRKSTLTKMTEGQPLGDKDARSDMEASEDEPVHAQDVDDEEYACMNSLFKTVLECCWSLAEEQCLQSRTEHLNRVDVDDLRALLQFLISLRTSTPICMVVKFIGRMFVSCPHAERWKLIELLEEAHISDILIGVIMLCRTDGLQNESAMASTSQQTLERTSSASRSEGEDVASGFSDSDLSHVEVHGTAPVTAGKLGSAEASELQPAQETDPLPSPLLSEHAAEPRENVHFDSEEVLISILELYEVMMYEMLDEKGGTVKTSLWNDAISMAIARALHANKKLRNKRIYQCMFQMAAPLVNRSSSDGVMMGGMQRKLTNAKFLQPIFDNYGHIDESLKLFILQDLLLMLKGHPEATLQSLHAFNWPLWVCQGLLTNINEIVQHRTRKPDDSKSNKDTVAPDILQACLDMHVKFLSEVSLEELRQKGGFRYVRQLLFVIDWAAQDESVYGDGGTELNAIRLSVEQKSQREEMLRPLMCHILQTVTNRLLVELDSALSQGTMEVIAARGSVKAEKAVYATAVSVRQLKLNAMGLLVLVEHVLRTEYRKLLNYEPVVDVNDGRALDEATSTLAVYGAGAASVSLPYWLQKYFCDEAQKTGGGVLLGYPQLEDDLSRKPLPVYPYFVELLRCAVSLVKALIERGDVYLPQEQRRVAGLPIVRSTRSIVVMLRLVVASIRTEHFLLHCTDESMAVQGPASDDDNLKETTDRYAGESSAGSRQEFGTSPLSQNQLEILEQLPARVLSVMLQKNADLEQESVLTSIRILHAEVCSAYHCGQAPESMTNTTSVSGLHLDTRWLTHTQTQYLTLILPLLKTLLRNIRGYFNELFSWELAPTLNFDSESVEGVLSVPGLEPCAAANALTSAFWISILRSPKMGEWFGEDLAYSTPASSGTPSNMGPGHAHGPQPSSASSSLDSPLQPSRQIEVDSQDLYGRVVMDTYVQKQALKAIYEAITQQVIEEIARSQLVEAQWHGQAGDTSQGIHLLNSLRYKDEARRGMQNTDSALRQEQGFRLWQSLVRRLDEVDCLFCPFHPYRPPTLYELDPRETRARQRLRFVRNYELGRHEGAAVSTPGLHKAPEGDDGGKSGDSGSSASPATELQRMLKENNVSFSKRDSAPVDDSIYDADAPSQTPALVEGSSIPFEQDKLVIDAQGSPMQPGLGSGSAASSSTGSVSELTAGTSPMTQTSMLMEASVAATRQQKLQEGRTQIAAKASLVSAMETTDGEVRVTGDRLIFLPAAVSRSRSTDEEREMLATRQKEKTWRLDQLLELYDRRYLLKNCAVELFFLNGTTVFLSFADSATRRRVFQVLKKSCPEALSVAHDKAGKASFQQLKRTLTEKWVRRELSNFDYLMELNTLAGRSFNDITQYPVFPWIIADYTSETLDLKDPTMYRDLSKPVGALNPQLLERVLERFETFQDPIIPPFHYGSHYSTGGTVLHYLVRVEPFTTLAIQMQDGKLDHADRLFYNIAGAWESCMEDMGDVKELIPEFFYLPEMFLNTNSIDFGTKQDGDAIGDVVLPPWASSAADFVKIHRDALESEYVRKNLHHWIDLVFGYKQQGPEAVKAHNLFFYTTYEGQLDLDSIKDPLEQKAMQDQIAYFGQTPQQLFAGPHPPASPHQGLAYTVFNEPKNTLRFALPVPEETRVALQVTQTAVVEVDEYSLTPLAHRWNPRLTGSDGSPFSFFPSRRVHGTSFIDTASNIISSWTMSLVGRSSASSSGDKGHLISTSSILNLNVMNNAQDVWRKANSIAIMPDGNGVITAGHVDAVLKLQSLNSKESHVLHGHSSRATCVAISEHSDFVVSGSDDCTVAVWLLTRSQDSVVSKNGATSRQSRFLNDIGRASRDKLIKVTGADLSEMIEDDHLNKVDRPRPSYLPASGGRNRTGSLVSPKILIGPMRTLRGHGSPVLSVDIRSDLDLVASCSYHGGCLLHSFTTGQLTRRIQSVRGPGLRISPSGLVIVSDPWTGTLSTWNMNGLRIASIAISPEEGQVSCIDVANDGQHVVVGTCLDPATSGESQESGYVTFRHLHSLTPIFKHKISKDKMGARCVKMSPRDHSVIISYTSGLLQVMTDPTSNIMLLDKMLDMGWNQ